MFSTSCEASQMNRCSSIQRSHLLSHLYKRLLTLLPLRKHIEALTLLSSNLTVHHRILFQMMSSIGRYFEGHYPRRYLQHAIFASKPLSQKKQCETDEAFSPSEHVHPRRSSRYGFREEDTPRFIDRFLRHVHIKNPILDEEMLRRKSDRAIEEGLGWDACSCLVVRTPIFFSHGTITPHAGLQFTDKVEASRLCLRCYCGTI